MTPCVTVDAWRKAVVVLVSRWHPWALAALWPCRACGPWRPVGPGSPCGPLALWDLSRPWARGTRRPRIALRSLGAWRSCWPGLPLFALRAWRAFRAPATSQDLILKRLNHRAHTRGRQPCWGLSDGVLDWGRGQRFCHQMTSTHASVHRTGTGSQHRSSYTRCRLCPSMRHSHTRPVSRSSPRCARSRVTSTSHHHPTSASASAGRRLGSRPRRARRPHPGASETGYAGCVAAWLRRSAYGAPAQSPAHHRGNSPGACHRCARPRNPRPDGAESPNVLTSPRQRSNDPSSANQARSCQAPVSPSKHTLVCWAGALSR